MSATNTTLSQSLRAALRQVIDPELGMNIVDLGLIYRLDIGPQGVALDLTMTSPACPLGEMILQDVESALRAALPADTAIALNLVWSPPWSPALMSPEARQHFGWAD